MCFLLCPLGFALLAWSKIQAVANGGTRTRLLPLGDGSKASEFLAVEQAAWIAECCKALDYIGSKLGLDNPSSSSFLFALYLLYLSNCVSKSRTHISVNQKSVENVVF